MTETKQPEALNLLIIFTVTMNFDPIEDRIVMNSSDKKGKVERLWLSRRLLDKLIPTLTDQLEMNSSNKIPTELEQSLAQEKAEIDKEKLEAVKMKAQNPSWLVTTIKVARNKNDFRLLFIGQNTGDDGCPSNQAKFDLATENLRQWLNAICKIYAKAEWDTKAFPLWIKENRPDSKKPILLN